MPEFSTESMVWKGSSVDSYKFARTNLTISEVDPAAIPQLPPPPRSKDGQIRNHTAMYIHVGKTGGITLDKVLYSNCIWYEGKIRREKCLRGLNGPSQVSETTKATLHFGPRRDYVQWIDEVTLFLFSLRNPIHRAVSAYYFDHPSNNRPNRFGEDMSDDIKHFYIECFPTIHDMVDLLDSTGKGKKMLSTRQQNCFDIARQTLAGNGSTMAASHLRMNYNFYHRLSTAKRSSRPVLVLRTEHLWNDLSRVDRMLGGTGEFQDSGMSYTHGSQYHAVHEGPTARGKRVLCCYLVPELQLYNDLLYRAINLLPAERDATMEYVFRDCGLDSPQSKNHLFSWRDWASQTCSLSTEVYT